MFPGACLQELQGVGRRAERVSLSQERPVRSIKRAGGAFNQGTVRRNAPASRRPMSDRHFRYRFRPRRIGDIWLRLLASYSGRGHDSHHRSESVKLTRGRQGRQKKSSRDRVNRRWVRAHISEQCSRLPMKFNLYASVRSNSCTKTLIPSFDLH